MKKLNFQPLALIFLFMIACTQTETVQENAETEKKPAEPIFSLLAADRTGVTFENTLTENDTLNYFSYPYLYMGGGVAADDFDNDGLTDLYFTANMLPNRLFRNTGDLKFEDITEKSGTGGGESWFTGVTTADVNGDGFTDIYACVSGLKTHDRRNKLFINNGDLTFTEKANEYGIADNGHSTQATFFDYDNDGDLDLFVINYPPANFKSPLSYFRHRMDNVSDEETDKLFRNDGEGKFTDVTEASGLKNYGLSLGVVASDINKDGFVDLYISNDFSTPDYLFMNAGDGTFTDRAKEYTKHTAMYGMGVDIADFNNDGHFDILQADMTPEDNQRSKANMASMNPGLFWGAVQMGMHYQYMQNSLQLNNGIVDGKQAPFSDISRMAGVALTDWSWSTLFADLDNDGLKDIFIANGTRRDINNKDFFEKLGKMSYQYKKDLDPVEYVKTMPSEKVDNYAFRNNGDLTFDNSTKDWGLSFEGYSNGAVYADLDNDGDLELIINNIDQPASIFQNSAAGRDDAHFLRFGFKYEKGKGVPEGTRIEVKAGGKTQISEYTRTRGYQSSVEPFLHFGLGKSAVAEQVTVTWPDGKTQEMKNVPADQILTLAYGPTGSKSENVLASELRFEELTGPAGIDFKHVESLYDDYKKEPLLPHVYSRLGPVLAVGDVNGDGTEDVFAGGASSAPGRLFLQNAAGEFAASSCIIWEKDVIFEDTGVLFFDADGDKDLDLYVASGGNEFPAGDKNYNDRLYLNDGTGNFTKAGKDFLPESTISSGRVKSIDFDADGDLDLFVAGRQTPQKYPWPTDSRLLENNSGKFTDVSKDKAPGFTEIGMVTDVLVVDFDSDGTDDIVLTGEWMPVTFFKNSGGEFTKTDVGLSDKNTSGWWYSLAAGDFNNDGKPDIVAGNLGLNYKYKASEKKPFEVFSKDFDQNGTNDIVLSKHSGGKLVPLRGRECSSQQIPQIKVNFPSYNKFSNATLSDIYGEKDLRSALHYEARNFASSILLNNGAGKFTMSPLPNYAQISAVNGIVVTDLNGDGNVDLILAGNLFGAEIETTRNDASNGCVLLGKGDGTFSALSHAETGLIFSEDVKDLKAVQTAQGLVLMAANNNAPLTTYLLRKTTTATASAK